MTAPSASVAAVQKALGCWFEDTVAGVFCNKHHCYADQRHESIDMCEVAVAAADAAVEAATPGIQAGALREAAVPIASALSNRLLNVGHPPETTGTVAALVQRALRDRADRIEARP